jgi:hypothetical protein
MHANYPVIDPDVAAMLEEARRAERLSKREAVNRAFRWAWSNLRSRGDASVTVRQ